VAGCKREDDHLVSGRPRALEHAHVTTTMTYDTAITDADEAADLLPDLH